MELDESLEHPVAIAAALDEQGRLPHPQQGAAHAKCLAGAVVRMKSTHDPRLQTQDLDRRVAV